MYKVAYLDSVEEDLKKLDKSTVRKILSRIETYLACDPKELGKPLKGEFSGYWRYRWGDYRVIYKISEREILILVLRISNRKDVYRA
ncbi:MAG: type II toxin-antitoxin system RelE/ParE family toxin [Candidatus Omnitrophica bacterium]|nr:type II toxin-antitoxin system RelE/ParE family toxin [Candidatus Omnitrophota bacterium]MBU4303643.1 type II toxin-antitoxin system RelE/ParE family toxin [Candidatus Omnitrophota bacterium]MBU4418562.1 type II toxin-antitoxin system RelE/ParE family toxin [Candidatus Omnitrophota bacterium]MBU4467237.1 type II toxin-antitoxin system RelE/ParE family toxin [Candidatus Omnitrophota bacterium]MCG2707637.1 type II toxin-antitoxin system RelE/ParE family toxin [Candidatus Omnitrophota bacterium